MEKVGNLIQGILNRASKPRPQTSTPSSPSIPAARQQETTQNPQAAPTDVGAPQAQHAFGGRTAKPAYRQPVYRVPNRSKSTPIAITSILKNVIKDKGLEADVARYQFVLHWKEIVGENLAAVTKPECLRRDVLVVRVESSVRAQELSFQKFEILGRLQPFLARGQSVTDIAFYVAG